MPGALLLTKLFPPPARSALVPRPRLVERVLDGRRLGRKLALLSAPPGFGKTTLVTEILQQASCRAAWFSVDSADNDPVRFWRYVLAALRRLNPGLGELTLAMLEANQPPPLVNVLTGLINDLAVLPEPLILVIDDYHLIEAAAVHESINFFIDYLPPQVLLLLTTRADPPLSLARRRGRMEMTEIRAVDLRFSREEAVEFFRIISHLDLPPKELEILLRRTEGWAAGLQLAGLALQGLGAADPGASSAQSLADFVATFAGDDHYIGDYLVEEVLQRQSSDVQDFLLQTAVLDRFCAPLCAAVIGNISIQTVQAMLTALDHANLFLAPLDNRQEWFRYHRLFGELLQRQLIQTQGVERVQELHQRASHWFEQAGLWNEAVDHALLAGDEERAVSITDQRAAELFEQSEMPALREWILRLPERQITSRISLCIPWAWASMSTGHEAETIRAVIAIEKALGLSEHLVSLEPYNGARLDPGFTIVLINVSILRATLDIHSLELHRAIQRTNAAMAFLNTLDREAYGPVVLSFNCVCFFNLGICYHLLGDAARARDAFINALDYSDLSANPHILPMAGSHLAQIYAAEARLHLAYETYQISLSRITDKGEKPSPLSCIIHSGLGELALERNDLDQAEAQFLHCLELGIPWNAWEALIPAFMGLANLFQARKDPKSALAYLDQADKEWIRTHTQGPLEEFRAWRALVQDDPELIAACAQQYDQREQAQEISLMYIVEDIKQLRARLWLRLGRLDRAEEILESVSVSAENAGRWGVLIHNLVLRSVLFQKSGKQPEALECLLRALELAEPSGYVRAFVSQGDSIASLLAQIAGMETVKLTIPRYARELFDIYQKESQVAGHGITPTAPVEKSPSLQSPIAQVQLVEPLTDRELQVLHLIAQGLTNSDISAKLVISAGTVKTHTNNIYSKLNVNSRTGAVAAARKLGVIV